jgi:hypothetical protein
MLFIEIDKIDREAHAEGVDRFAGRDPESLAVSQAAPAQQSLGSLAAGGRELNACGQLHIASEVDDPESWSWRSEPRRGEAGSKSVE